MKRPHSFYRYFFLVVAAWATFLLLVVRPAQANQDLFFLAETWQQGVLDLGQGVQDLQRTNTLLSQDNIRLKTAVQSQEKEIDALRAQWLILQKRHEQAGASLKNIQDRLLIITEQSRQIEENKRQLLQEQEELLSVISKEQERGQALEVDYLQKMRDIKELERSFFDGRVERGKQPEPFQEVLIALEGWFQSQEQSLQSLDQELSAMNHSLANHFLQYQDGRLSREDLLSDTPHG